MEYTLTKNMSGIRIVPDEEGFKAIVDYTVSGKGTHAGVVLDINTGISVEISIPVELVMEADQKAQEHINNLYKND